MPDYSKSKIYEIVCNLTGERYIGSTTQTLSQRLGKHRDISNVCKSKQIIDKGDYYINLLESYPCNNKDELRMKEREWFDKLENINKVKPYISIDETKQIRSEYMKTEKIKKIHKIYRDNHKEEAKEYNIKYRDENKEELSIKKREYQLKNKNKLKTYSAEWRKEILTCICGSSFCKDNKSKHKKTQKHKTFLQNNSTVKADTHLICSDIDIQE